MTQTEEQKTVTPQQIKFQKLLVEALKKLPKQFIDQNIASIIKNYTDNGYNVPHTHRLLAIAQIAFPDEGDNTTREGNKRKRIELYSAIPDNDQTAYGDVIIQRLKAIEEQRTDIDGQNNSFSCAADSLLYHYEISHSSPNQLPSSLRGDNRSIYDSLTQWTVKGRSPWFETLEGVLNHIKEKWGSNDCTVHPCSINSGNLGSDDFKEYLFKKTILAWEGPRKKDGGYEYTEDELREYKIKLLEGLGINADDVRIAPRSGARTTDTVKRQVPPAKPGIQKKARAAVEMTPMDDAELRDILGSKEVIKIDEAMFLVASIVETNRGIENITPSKFNAIEATMLGIINEPKFLKTYNGKNGKTITLESNDLQRGDDNVTTGISSRALKVALGIYTKHHIVDADSQQGIVQRLSRLSKPEMQRE